MADVFYNTAKHKMWSHATLGINLLSDTIKCMLTSTATPYTPDDDDDFVDESGANDPIDAEAVVTNYTGGFAGAGRKTLASKAVVTDKTNARAEFDCADITWTALGNGSNQTIAHAIFIKEITNDAASPLIALFDFSDFTTNGSDFTLQFDAEGALHLTSMFGALQLAGRIFSDLWSAISEAMSPKVQKLVRELTLNMVKPHIVRRVKPLRMTPSVQSIA